MISTGTIGRMPFARSLFLKSSAMPLIPLTEQFPNLPSSTSSALSTKEGGAFQTTKLGSGLKVASDDKQSPVTSIGVYVDAGTRYENEASSGLSNLMSKMCFRSTKTRSDLRFFRDVEALGGSICSSYDRENLNMRIQVMSENVNDAMELLAESVLAPRLATWDVAGQKNVAYDAVEEALLNPINSVMDGVHSAAYYDTKPLGRGLYDAENIKRLTAQDVEGYYTSHFNTNNMTIVGTGIPHTALSELTGKYFADAHTGSKVTTTTSKYVGGEKLFRNLSTDKTMVALGFEGVARNSPFFTTSYVLKQHLQTLLQKKAQVFNTVYSDSGIFGIVGECDGVDSLSLFKALVSQMKSAANKKLSGEELVIAKIKASKQYALDISDPSTRFDIIGTMAQHGDVAPISTVLSAIDAVTAEELMSLAQSLIKSKPSVSAYGRLENVPRYDAVLAMLK